MKMYEVDGYGNDVSIVSIENHDILRAWLDKFDQVDDYDCLMVIGMDAVIYWTPCPFSDEIHDKYVMLWDITRDGVVIQHDNMCMEI